ncbi:CDP-diacylglycerol--glycerol-3-phosphate 3-phosphatidyltransferase [Methylosinus sp. Ce-a6]|uniref:CDP-diacylglycerol--glycerol-3-phosphate 3-phosphatidyltransferase n=1 Tax=Methylosinus sp. Ce-a6 TaxID=2172005 RepID=UPI001FCE889A|nr:CDP-diacylglycerol--glycerol-3-phosphate 3-phosphatidyltransferase [Methylosinus sp. Ce-a6]
MFLRGMTSTAIPPRRGRALSLPNILTYGRLVAVPVVAGLLQWPDEYWMRWTALGVFTAAAITDFFDGYLARAWAQQSSLGAMLDPIADKLLVAATLLMVVADQTITGVTIWAALIILCREILVSGLREYLAELKVPLPVSAIAKWKTTLQLFALGFFIAGRAGELVLPGTVNIGSALLWIAALLTLYTGYDYMRAGWAHFGTDEAR